MRQAQEEPRVDAEIGVKIGGRVACKFERREVQNLFKSIDAGSPVYEEKLFLVKLLPGGDELPVPVKQEQIEKFSKMYPKEWASFQGGDRMAVDGMPLGEWGTANASQVRTLEGINVFTVEQLADLPDAVLQKFGLGSLALRDKARTFLKSQTSASEILKLKEQIAALQAALGDEVFEDAETLSTDGPVIADVTQPKRRGRPRLIRSDEPTE